MPQCLALTTLWGWSSAQRQVPSHPGQFWEGQRKRIQRRPTTGLRRKGKESWVQLRGPRAEENQRLKVTMSPGFKKLSPRKKATS
jgi:hypothetical protein